MSFARGKCQQNQILTVIWLTLDTTDCVFAFFHQTVFLCACALGRLSLIMLASASGNVRARLVPGHWNIVFWPCKISLARHRTERKHKARTKPTHRHHSASDHQDCSTRLDVLILSILASIKVHDTTGQHRLRFVGRLSLMASACSVAQDPVDGNFWRKERGELKHRPVHDLRSSLTSFRSSCVSCKMSTKTSVSIPSSSFLKIPQYKRVSGA